MTKELLIKTITAIECKLSKSKLYANPRLYDYWSYNVAEFTFGNNRKARIFKHIPNPTNSKGNKIGVYYTIEYVGCSNKNIHMTMEQVAEKLYKLGIENVDPFKYGVNTKKLKDLGFKQVEPLQEPNIKDIGFMLEDGFYQYKLEIDENSIYYGCEYDTSTSPFYYGSIYQDTFRREYVYIRRSDKESWSKVLYRDVKVGSRCVSNYVGD